MLPLTEPPPEASSSVAREYFFAGSKGRTVKARAAARRGSLDRIPAFGTFAGMTDGEAGISRDALPCTRPLRNEMRRRYAMPQKTAIPMSRIDARIPLSVRETIERVASVSDRYYSIALTSSINLLILLL